MIELKEKHCVPVEDGTRRFNNKEILRMIKYLPPGWTFKEDKKLYKKFPFDNFKRGMAFAQDIAILSERENHYPDLCIHFSHVEVELSTHVLEALTENDFIMAARIDEL